jgi:hypothetical protein
VVLTPRQTRHLLMFAVSEDRVELLRRMHGLR